MNMYPMLARGLLFVYCVIVAFALQSLHNLGKNAKFHVVETSPASTFLGDFLVNTDQLLDSKGLLKEFLSHFPLPKVFL